MPSRGKVSPPPSFFLNHLTVVIRSNPHSMGNTTYYPFCPQSCTTA